MDGIKLAINLLSADTGVTALVASRIYGGALPEHYDPTFNPAIVLHIRGGHTHPEMPIRTVSVGVTVWAGINEFVQAHAVYEAIFNALHGVCNKNFGADGHVISCLEQTPGQDIPDPEAGWVTVVAFYEMTIRQ